MRQPLSCFLIALTFICMVRSEPSVLDPHFEQLVDRYLADFRGVGTSTLPPFDGSASWYDRSLAAATSLLHEVQAVPSSSLTFDQQLDRKYLIGLLETRVMDGERVKRWQQDPRQYLDITPIISTRGGLLNDELKPLGERAKRILESTRLVPVRLGNGRHNLAKYIQIWQEPSLQVIEADLEIFTVDVPRFAARVPEQKAALLPGSG